MTRRPPRNCYKSDLADDGRKNKSGDQEYRMKTVIIEPQTNLKRDYINDTSNKTTSAQLPPSKIPHSIQLIHLTTLLLICRIKSRPSYLLTYGSILILKTTIRTISDFIVLFATTNLRVLDILNEGSKYLAEGVTTRNTSSSRVIGQVLIGRRSSTTCVTTIRSVCRRNMRQLDVPHHHEVTAISSICGHFEL
jgi:hypothetical protein